MIYKKTAARSVEAAWKHFVTQAPLSENQVQHFKRYLALLIEWNKKVNLTAITDEADILSGHFQDSLHIADYIDLNTIHTVVDIGSGAGFPGIPLKICYPHLSMILIEVNRKKIAFLQEVIKILNLENIEIYTLDWRTFLRQTTYDVDLFLARASLKPEELIRMFKPGCAYKEALLVYWASKYWQQGNKEAPFVYKEERYTINNKQRRFIFFKHKNIDD